VNETLRTTIRIRQAAVVALAGLGFAAVAGLAYASASGPAASAQQYQYPPGQKLTICHHTGSESNPHRTITVSARAWQAHQRHGDTLGPCPSGQAVTKHSNAAHVKKFHKGKTLRGELRAEKAKANANAQKGKARGKGKGKGRP